MSWPNFHTAADLATVQGRGRVRPRAPQGAQLVALVMAPGVLAALGRTRLQPTHYVVASANGALLIAPFHGGTESNITADRVLDAGQLGVAPPQTGGAT